jgi:hypothetical protein
LASVHEMTLVPPAISVARGQEADSAHMRFPEYLDTLPHHTGV